MYCVFWTAVGSRFVWAMAQPHLLVMNSGELVLDEEHSQQIMEEDAPAIARYIKIGILPRMLGRTWKRTGAPLGGVIYITVTSIILMTFIDFEMTVVIGTYCYIATYFLTIWSFMVMRLYEPDAESSYKFPGGMVGAWTFSVLNVGIMLLIAVYMAVELYWSSVCVFLGMDVLCIVYYFTVKRWLDGREDMEDREQMEPLLREQVDDGMNNENTSNENAAVEEVVA